MNDRGDCRIAPATPGLLNMKRVKTIQIIIKIEIEIEIEGITGFMF